MLNSAAAVTLPSSIEPPISTISCSRGTIAGSLMMARATLVSGPIGHRVTVPGGSRMIVSMMTSTACPAATGRGGLGQRGAVEAGSRHGHTPRSPAVAGSGAAQPAWTGMSARPASARICCALRVVRASGTLPATVVSAEDLDLVRRCQGQQDGDGVVLAGVAVEDDAMRGHVSLR